MQNKNRRNFLKKTALVGAAGLASLPFTTQARVREKDIPQDLTIVFQGDSITDAWRRKERYYANDGHGMGDGYVYQIVSTLLGSHPTKNIRCYNRGISGHKVFQLANRWEDDCLQLAPDVLSILIGVNDFWHTLTHGYKGTVEVFDKDLRALLDRSKKANPNLKILLCEPFAVEGGTAIGPEWFPAFEGYQKAVKNISDDYKTAFVPFQRLFDEALKVSPVSYWCPDGVHPSVAGAYLMAQAWLKAFEEMI